MAIAKNLVINLDYLVEEIQKYIDDLHLSPEQANMALSYIIMNLEKRKRKIGLVSVIKGEWFERFVSSDC